MKNDWCCLVQWNKNVCSNRACASVHLEQQVQVGAQVYILVALVHKNILGGTPNHTFNEVIC